ncbi:MAG TPA: glycosyltransferase family 1 protein [Humidesulfovibrio sp.]|uniref:glycosyltransferase family 1 protein n=1 Tax=Humidesulfovibrio sp. TaxID=2910988 RepID=UPI002BACC5A4|nr:glycosyltransferase family 1 protein [Humidesulfovibrio sp.]HWR02481.1 glycosyltransferase family 1 protein [Humidesulfovibrio sp.]
MKILMIAVNDPAGTGIGFCRAVNRLDRHKSRIVTLETRYTHSWPKDLHVPDLDGAGLSELEDLLKTSDVLHFHMTADEHLRLGPFLPADYLAGKAIVHHEHGHHDFRSNPEAFREKYRRLGRKNLLVSTPDLKRMMPEARWQPNLVHQDEEPLRPAERQWTGPLRLAHSPTRKDLKNTDELLAVVGALRGEGLGLELDFIDNVPHAECLARKRTNHALFDHMQGYYGVSSLEGLSQGLAVIAGLDAWNLAHVAEFAGVAGADLPWVLAHDSDSLARSLRVLAGDLERCRAVGQASRRFVEECWSEAKVAGHLCDFWDAL